MDPHGFSTAFAERLVGGSWTSIVDRHQSKDWLDSHGSKVLPRNEFVEQFRLDSTHRHHEQRIGAVLAENVADFRGKRNVTLVEWSEQEIAGWCTAAQRMNWAVVVRAIRCTMTPSLPETWTSA